MKKQNFTKFLLVSLLFAVSSVQAQTVSTFGWDDYANFSGTRDDGVSISGAPGAGHHYNPGLGDTTVTGPSVNTTLSVTNGLLSIPAQQNFVKPANFNGIFSPGTADGLEFGDNHSNTVGSGLWHTSTLEFGQNLEMTGSQFMASNSGAIDFGGFLIFNSSSSRTINLVLTGGAVFDDINLLPGFGDDYTLSGLGTPNVTMSFTSGGTGTALYNPVISGTFSALSISQSDMVATMSTNEPVIYYRNDSASLAAVPEPSGMALMVLAGALATNLRRANRAA